jgi:hypothetical protein
MDAAKMKARNAPKKVMWSSGGMTFPLLPKVNPDHSDSKEGIKQNCNGEDEGWEGPSDENRLPQNIRP